MTDHADRETDLERVLEIADRISGDRQASLIWLCRPLREFEDQTPEALVLGGRVGDVIAYLNSVSNGFVG